MAPPSLDIDTLRERLLAGDGFGRLVAVVVDAQRHHARAAAVERAEGGDARPDLDPQRFRADYAALGALNAARILGPVFARQIVLFGRDKYRAFMPRTWRALERNLQHPGMAGLKTWFDRHVPEDARA